ncbi:MAG: triphosphoribosyl-dephospho-CoA synthase CitG [Clostridiales bacterium]|nr:triphosphoribosyl-dephospho-CoA synthase CitG [Clostridiales bacterium]
MDNQPVILPEMLEARELRVLRQQDLLRHFGKPLICFTMNIPGPVKNSLSIRRGFLLGSAWLQQQLDGRGIPVLFSREWNAHTGDELYLVPDCEAPSVKEITVALEDGSPLGRLFDMDVLTPDGAKIGRQELGQPERPCLLCGKPGRECARSRAHTVEELQHKTEAILTETFQRRDARKAAELAVRSLLYEVAVTPKPGLVDRNNSGSHRDMDFFTFLNSAASLYPYFEACALAGRKTAGEAPSVTFQRIRAAGIQAEQIMLHATGGVNTHKGAIFSVGLLCAALGRLERSHWKEPETVLQECAALVKGLSEGDFSGVTEETAVTTGQRLYLRYGITGVRGQAEAGFPAVLRFGLPKLEEGVEQGLPLNDAGCAALLSILAHSVDTNLIARSDLPTQQRVAEEIAQLLVRDPFPTEEQLRSLDKAFVARNLSPGGSADLLAVCYLLYFLRQEGEDDLEQEV